MLKISRDCSLNASQYLKPCLLARSAAGGEQVDVFTGLEGRMSPYGDDVLVSAIDDTLYPMSSRYCRQLNWYDATGCKGVGISKVE
jgi:hypothetical protein